MFGLPDGLPTVYTSLHIEDSAHLATVFYRVFLNLPACVLSCFSCVQVCATLWTVALQALLSMGFSRLFCPWDSPGKNAGAGCHAPCAFLWELWRFFVSTSSTYRNIDNLKSINQTDIKLMHYIIYVKLKYVMYSDFILDLPLRKWWWSLTTMTKEVDSVCFGISPLNLLFAWSMYQSWVLSH